MATRINTKFVITLVSVIVLIVLGLIFAVTFLSKTAEDHNKLAEAAMVRADAAIAQGDVKLHNSERKRAAKHFGAAVDKDATNIDYLHGFLDATQQVICDNLTTAGNEFQTILGGASTIHDTPGATDEDRAVLYELLHSHQRMGFVTSTHRPLASILSFATKRLDIDPDDPVAGKYFAIATGHRAQERVDEEEVTADIEAITSAIRASPDEPLLYNALARYYMGNARRLSRASGNRFTPAVNESFALSLENVDKAMQLAQDDPPALIEAAAILADIRFNDPAKLAELNARQLAAAAAIDAMLKDKSNRDALFVAELNTAIALIRRARADETADPPRTFDGLAAAMRLAESLPQDRPDEPNAYEVLGNMQRDVNEVEQAVATLQQGIQVQRNANANEYILDAQSRLDMELLLADLQCNLALLADTAETRRGMLDAIGERLKELALADTLNVEARDARVAFLSGRVALTQNNPQLAVSRLEEANRAYNSRDPRTLRLLAQAHAQMGNDALVVDFYEAIVENNLRATGDDLLNLINLYINPGEKQQLGRAQELLNTYRAQLPGDMRGVRLQARLLQNQGRVDAAIALLREQDLAANPELLTEIAQLQASTGNTDGVIDILRDRLAQTPDGETMNLQLVSRLLSLIDDTDEKRAELDRLVSEGLDPAFAEIVKRTMNAGQTKLEDELAMLDVLQEDPAERALQKFLAYRRWNQPEAGRALLDRAIELAPDSPSVLDWRYRIALDERRWDAAQSAISDILKLPENDRPEGAIADGRFMRAQVIAQRAGVMEAGEERNKLVREAILAYERALDRYSHYIDGWIQLGRLHLSQNNELAAQQSLQEALNRQSRNVVALELLALSQARSGDRINALENYQRVLEIQPNRASALNQFSALAVQMGMATRAIQLRENIQTRLPNNFDNRRALSLLYAANNAFEDANNSIDALIAEQGKTLQNIAAKSQILLSNGENDRAVATVKGYMTERGDQAQWRDHLLLAQAYERAGQTGQADLSFNQAIALERAEGSIGSVAAFAQVKVNRGQIADAAQLLEALFDAYPENDALKQQSAELYLQLRDYDKVEAIARKLPDSANRYRLLVQSAASQNGKLGIAIERVGEAVRAYPSDFGLRLNRVELLRTQQDVQSEDQRDYTGVLDQANLLEQDFPDRVEAKVALADVLLRMNRVEPAVAELQQVLSVAPRHIPSNQRLFQIRLLQAERLAASDPIASQQRGSEAIAIASLLLENQSDAAALLASAGRAAQLAGLNGRAVDFYKRAFDAAPTTENLATYALALLSVNQGANARAVLESPSNATLVSSSLQMRALRGRAIAAAGQPDTAATLFVNLLKESQGDDQRMIVAQQIAATFTNEPQRAVGIFESALGQDLPASIESVLGTLLVGRQQFDPAIQRLGKYWDNPAADVGTQITLLTQLALSQQQTDRFEQAKATYERVYDLIAENKDLASRLQQIQLLNNMAFLLADQLPGYESDAVRYAEQAVQLMNESDPIRRVAQIEDTLGWAYHRAGNNEDAIRMLRQSIDRLPLAANQLHLGKVYLSMNDKDRALLVLERAVNQARADRDEAMIAETQEWYREAL